MYELQIVINESALAWVAGLATAPVTGLIAWFAGRRKEAAQITDTAETRLWERMVQYIGLVEQHCADEQARMERRLDDCEERVNGRLTNLEEGGTT